MSIFASADTSYSVHRHTCDEPVECSLSPFILEIIRILIIFQVSILMTPNVTTKPESLLSTVEKRRLVGMVTLIFSFVSICADIW